MAYEVHIQIRKLNHHTRFRRLQKKLTNNEMPQ